MDAIALLRSLGGLMAVLAMLSAALWAVRRYDIRLPGRQEELLRRVCEAGRRVILVLMAGRPLALTL